MRTGRAVMDFLIRKKFTFSLVIIFLVIMITSFFAIDTLRLQEYDSVRINLSGRQRMLSQKMTKEIILYNVGEMSKDDVLSTAKVFSATLIALKDGGDAPLNLSMTEFETIPEMENKDTKGQLETVMSSWNIFKQKIESVLENNDASSMNYIVDNNTKLLNEMDTAVVMMQHNAEEKITRLYWIIALGILVSILVLIVAITKETQRKYIRQIEQTNIELTAVNKEMESFSYSVSHDLRAPLRSMDGFSLVLLEDYSDKLDEQGKDYLQRVRSATQRMGMLIDDMLSLSRVTRSEMKRELVDLSSLVQSIAAELQKSQSTCQVEFIIAPGLTANGDARLLRILLENLLGNAWKFTGTHPKARIEFGTTQVDGEQVFFIRDDGVGFDMKYADKLFGVFQRLHGASEFPGTGVGLATVQRIVHRHGGRVWAEGEVEKGATFYFTL